MILIPLRIRESVQVGASTHSGHGLQRKFIAIIDRSRCSVSSGFLTTLSCCNKESAGFIDCYVRLYIVAVVNNGLLFHTKLGPKNLSAELVVYVCVLSQQCVDDETCLRNREGISNVVTSPFLKLIKNKALFNWDSMAKSKTTRKHLATNFLYTEINKIDQQISDFN